MVPPQDLVHVFDGNFSVASATPDAPLVTLTDINRGKSYPTCLSGTDTSIPMR